MAINQRRTEITAALRAEHTVRISELAQKFQVSRETIRKDLYRLEDEGVATVIRGGAVLRDQRRESAFEQRRTLNIETKRAIARQAASLVEPGMTVFLDYGTTMQLLAERLVEIGPLTVVTNTLPIAGTLLTNPEIALVIPGGNVRADESSLSGPLALSNLQRLYFDIGFFGCAGISADRGVTNFHVLEADFSRQAIAHANRSYLLADSSKFGTAALNKVVPLSALDAVITDEAVDPEQAEVIRDAGLDVRLAKTS
ncbi:DeoR/GlpR family DNA-binding transcription regulator [uncultured Gulosibacter sp.]|uniref:DeoR/GlpR family DNA-binding transcription regulator n=1 Tax=uncultured Gulosibacter sp. TaxID=1339167 RepID=UPI00288901CE|nr:DeoR/GlpR family DNA-binding transcription regulator [uncultured Gulosibacter sp.]